MVSRRVVVLLCLSISVLLVTAACSPAEIAANPAGQNLKPAAERNPAPDFELKDMSGKPARLSDYRGQVVLLNFWATWCGPCKLEIPWFVEFEQKHKDRGFAVLGVSMDEDGWEVVKPYLDRARVNYRILMGDNEVATLYGGVDSLPTTFLIDREGRIAAVHIGLVSKNAYESDIKTLLGTGASAVAAGDGNVLARVGRR